MENTQKHDNSGTAPGDKNCREPEATHQKKIWWNLRQCCEWKGISMKTTQNRRVLQPNCGKPDGIVGGRRVWRLSTVQKWVQQTDDDLTWAASKMDQNNKKGENDAQGDLRGTT